MNIIIKDTNASENIIAQSSAKWKFYSKKVIKFFIILYASGLFMFISGMIEFGKYGAVHFNGEIKHYTNWQFPESFGFVLHMIATYLLIMFFINKKKFFKKANEIAGRHLRTTNEITIQIQDDHISYKSYELVQEFKWWLISSYMIKDNYLFLNYDENYQSCLIIDKRLMSPEEFDQLLALVKQRVVLKL
jgi:hypothetical protein